MTKGKIFAIIIAFLCIIAVGTIAGTKIARRKCKT